VSRWRGYSLQKNNPSATSNPNRPQTKLDKNSPDGMLINCTLDMDRLKADALTRAISHVGTHIADLRDPKIPAAQYTPYVLEYHAWQTTILSSIGSQQKTLTLPGGYLTWNASWPNADRSKMADNAITSFLGSGRFYESNLDSSSSSVVDVTFPYRSLNAQKGETKAQTCACFLQSSPGFARHWPSILCCASEYPT
jgi:hypothetical protein